MIIKTKVILDRFWKGVSEKGNEYYNVLLRGLENGKTMYMYSKVALEEELMGKEVECKLKMWTYKDKKTNITTQHIMLEDIEKVL